MNLKVLIFTSEYDGINYLTQFTERAVVQRGMSPKRHWNYKHLSEKIFNNKVYRNR